MNLSIILNLSGQTGDNQATLQSLESELASLKQSVQVLVYPASAESMPDLAKLGELASVYVCPQEGLTRIQSYLDAVSSATGDYISQISAGDVYQANALSAVLKATSTGHPIISMKKQDGEGNSLPFADRPDIDQPTLLSLKKNFLVVPFYFSGTWIQKKYLKEEAFHTEYGLECEREFFIRICLETNAVYFLPNAVYVSNTPREGDITYFPDVYDARWYKESFTEFWIPYLTALTEQGPLPLFLQYLLLFSVNCRVLSNQNNLNKHVVPEGEELAHIGYLADALKLIDDDIIFNCHKVPACVMTDSYKWFYGILKHGEGYRFEIGYLAGFPYYKAANTFFNKISTLKTNVTFMNYEDGILTFEGSIHPILQAMADEIYIEFNGKGYGLKYTERYAHTKLYGVCIYKSHAFTVKLPMDDIKKAHIYCYAKFGDATTKIEFKYESHFSRMSGRFASSYWCFGSDPMYMMTRDNQGLLVQPTEKKAKRRQEFSLWKDMIKKKKKHDLIMLGVRMAYWATRPIIHNKPIWMYLDKIYKAGDSSEYLYRYASKQDNDFKHYYLVDKKASDYKRLKKDGFKPLVRGSIKHRLVFLNADMMVISNSTVFAFNDFGMVNSSYVRDLVDFHVCCVQHGMSVQKIAIAQNRLRDNTRLYFCASKYELQNLSRPIYDYDGHGALKLTGVPRYDGLVDRRKKQIMISPTWRMQAAVPVKTNEGQQRDYNSRFKESDYFRVFNSLINDPRLIEAAKQYDYRIKYVLHPIVSSQVDDFDKNDYVDIIPAVGDMSYEKMFCESSLMVTDFSGIQFDFAYMRKPLVYLHHKDIPQHYEEGTFFYDTMGFGEICRDNDELIDLLIEYMQNDCQMKPKYVRRADDFFFYRDHENCKRIYNEMLVYQDRYVFHKKDTLDVMPADPAAVKAAGKIIAAPAAKYGMTFPNDTIADCHHELPIREKTVLLLGLGKHVRGNMYFVLNELNHSDRYVGYQIYVRTDETTDAAVKNMINLNGWTRTETVCDNYLYSQKLESCQYLLTEVFFPEAWAKKPGQVVINIWHGTPLKKLGLDINLPKHHYAGTTQKNFIDADYLVYPNDYTRSNMQKSYRVDDLTTADTVMLGYPRTGGLMAAAADPSEEDYRRLAPNGETLYAFMPTWKDYLPEAQVIQDSVDLLVYLDAHLRDDQLLYVNLHHLVNGSIDYADFKHIRKFPGDMDSYLLLAQTKALITDYSSVFYDYLPTGKQIILYCGDYEEYKTNRGTYMDLMDLPFDKAVTPEDVITALNRGKQYDDTDACMTFCNYDSAENARKLCSLMLPQPDSDLQIIKHPAATGKKVLTFSKDFRASKATEKLQELIGNPSEAYIHHIGCEIYATQKNVAEAYPTLYTANVFGVVGTPHYSSLGRSAVNLFKADKITFEQLQDYMQYDYQAMAMRMFGQAKFDLINLYDVADPDIMQALLQIKDTRKVLFLNDNLLSLLREKRKYLRAVVKYAVETCDTVYNMTSESTLELKEEFGYKAAIAEFPADKDLNSVILAHLQ